MPVSEYSKDTNRTADVQTQDQTPFDTIIKNHPIVLKGLTECGYANASPIQVSALPVIIAGNDTIVEAKNGTGKTLTFVIPTLIKLKVEQTHLQSIILAPTREIAVQIQRCFKKVGQFLPGLKCEYFIGGTPVDVDKQKANGCQIAVGSPGRIKHLLNEHVLKGSEVKSFILDEVDRLFTDKNFIKDVRLIEAKLPKLKQMIVVSASIDKNDMSLFDEFMKEYIIVKGAEEDMNASQDPSKFLLGIKQYVACVKAVSTNIILLPAKNLRLLNILQNLEYTQCIIFTNYMTRVEAVCNMLRDHKYKADYIRGDQDQNIRLKLVDRLTSFKSKILVATDLIARGIDSSNVDLVINMDCPNDWATYLHRIGRAGRFGNKGNAFTILDDDKELKSFKQIINSIESVQIKILPIALEKPILEYKDDEFEDLNLTIESDVKLQNGNNVIEEITKGDKSPKDFELKSNDSNSNNCNSSVSNLTIEQDVHLQNGNNVIEENLKENKALNFELKSSDFESNNCNSSIHNLTIESDVKLQNGNNVIEEENIKDDKAPKDFHLKSSDSESKNYNSLIESKQTKSEYTSLEKLSQVVKETEKKLIDNHLIDERRLTADRSFILFDPESLLDDTDQYMKYSPQELIDIMTNYDSDFEKYEAAKKLMPEKCILQNNIKKDFSSNQVCLENGSSEQPNSTKKDESGSTHTDLLLQSPQSDSGKKQNTNEVNSEVKILSNETDAVIDSKTDRNKSQRPRFTNIYDLFQIPDFSLLKQAHNKVNANLANKENSDEPTLTYDKESIQKYRDKDDLCSVDSDLNNSEEEELSNVEEEELSNVEEEELSNVEEEELSNVEDEELSNVEEEELSNVEEEELSNVEEEELSIDEEEELSYLEEESSNLEEEESSSTEEKISDVEEEEEEGNQSFGVDIINSSNFNGDDHQKLCMNSNDKSNRYNIRDDVISQNSTHEIEENDENLVDYNILNDWYGQWQQQMSFIQTCVRMSK